MTEESKVVISPKLPDKATGHGERNDGIDLLRLLAALYIIVLHTMGRGGLLGRHLYLSWLIHTWAICGVNCFALISGYVGYRRRDSYYPNLSRYLSLWVEVFFYGLVMAVAYKLYLPNEVTAVRFIKALLPVSSSEYWYFTAYTGVFLVAPILCRALHGMSDRAAKSSMLVLFVLFSVIATLSSLYKDIFDLDEGYSFVWIALLYYFGAVVKKTGVLTRIRSAAAVVGIVALVLISEIWMLLSLRLELKNPVLLIQYISPTIAAISLLYLVLFSKVRVGEKWKKLLRFAAPGSFAVYLLNTNPCFWDYTLHDGFAFLMRKPVAWMLIVVPVFSLTFLVFAVCVDYLRRRLFSVLGVDKLCQVIGGKLDSLLTGRKEGERDPSA